MNLKQITGENWLEPDPGAACVCRVNTQTGISDVSASEWMAAFMEPRLGAGVPERVAELLEAARGAVL